MHPASAAGPPIVATPPAYSTQYVAYSPQQFPNQPLVQHVPHYQSQVSPFHIHDTTNQKQPSGSALSTLLSAIIEVPLSSLCVLLRTSKPETNTRAV